MIGDLPKSVYIAGTEFHVRTDYREILNILCAYDDPDLKDWEKVYVCLVNFYEDFDEIQESQYEAAYMEAMRFIEMGGSLSDKQKPSPRIIDWEQDEHLIFPAINSAAGFEVRNTDYMHWWTFMGYFMSMSEGTYSQVLSLRLKKAKGKALEKWEREFWAANRSICVLAERLTDEEKAEKERLDALLG